MVTLPPPRPAPARFGGLRGFTLLLLGGLLLITLLVLALAVYTFVYFTEQNSWQGRQAEATNNAASRVAAFLTQADRTLQVIDTLTNVSPTEAHEQLQQALRDILTQNEAFQELLILDPTGQPLATAERERAILANVFTIPQSIWFLEAQRGTPYLSDLQFTADDRAYVILARPMQTGGVVAVLLGMDVLRDTVAEVQLGNGGRAYLVTTTGQILAHTDYEVVLNNTNIAPREEWSAIRNSPNYQWSGAYTNFENEAVVGTSDGVTATNWILVTEIPQSEAFATSRTALLLLGGSTILFWLGAMVFSNNLLQRLIFTPLNRLRYGAEQVERGVLSHQVEVKRADEIGVVTQSFNKMAEKVKERTDIADSLYTISRALTQARTASSIVQTLAETLPSETKAQCLLFINHPAPTSEPEMLTLTAGWDEAKKQEITLPAVPGLSLVSDAFMHYLTSNPQEAYFSENVVADERIPAATREVVATLQAASAIFIPIVREGHLSGLLIRLWRDPCRFTEVERAVYGALPSVIAPIFYNIQLVENLKTNLTQLNLAREAAEESSRLKSEFVSTISHELRTPLNAIEGYTGILATGIGGITLEARAQRMVERIRLNSRRLLELVNDFLDLSRIESGRVELVQLPLSPTRLVARWQSETEILAQNKSLSYSVYVDPTLPDSILGDEDALSKIVLNLLSNAIKFTQKGDISLRVLNQEQTWTIEVKDSGIGIPASAHDYIFNEFRQVDGSSTREYGGTGLGLAIVQKLVRLMKGKIQLESEVAVGSTFTVILPLLSTGVSIPQEAA